MGTRVERQVGGALARILHEAQHERGLSLSARLKRFTLLGRIRQDRPDRGLDIGVDLVRSILPATIEHGALPVRPEARYNSARRRGCASQGASLRRATRSLADLQEDPAADASPVALFVSF